MKKIYLRIGLLALLTLLTSRLLFSLLDSAYQGSNRWVRLRMHSALAFLDNPPPPPAATKQMLVLGSSDIEVGFDPQATDQEFRKEGLAVESYNLGFRNLDPELLQLLSRRMVATLSARPKRLDLIVVGFAALRATEAYSMQKSLQTFGHFDDVEATIYDGTLLREDALAGLNTALQIGITKVIFGGVSPQSASSSLRGLFYTYYPWTYRITTPVRESFKTWGDIWASPELNRPPAWDLAARGNFYFGYPATRHALEQTFSRMSTPDVRKEIIANRAEDSDAIELHFDQRMIDAFARAAQELGKIANTVVILSLPSSIDRPPEAKARLARALREIQERSGAAVLDLGNPDPFVAGDFFDYFHFSPSGRAKLAQVLARSPLLKSALGRTN